MMSSIKGEAAASQHEKPNRKSNLLLGALLAAALIIIYRLAFDKIRTNKTLQTLKEDNKVLSEENEVLRKHISDHVCLKSDRNWEKHGDKCYYFNDLYLRWKGSRSFCEDLGADLVKIDSREEQEFLVEKVKNFVMDDIWEGFWIGLTDSEVEGNWTWVDGSPLDSRMKFWSEGEPDDYKAYSASGEDCVTIVKGEAEDLNSWTDYTCSVARKSICEKPAGTGLSSSVCG
ncbi:C-type lectin domain family 4 member E isoform X2 [Nothobranchius furzeri]|uniref:C-type lectin domain family 4 member E isoform X2 n=1 Tax=Nothobranchius furzeri TaxID=105023 RepID=UPI002403FA54|nr:C-type lectin domain family 4 member E-like [Nothobranchius furzeri]